MTSATAVLAAAALLTGAGCSGWRGEPSAGSPRPPSCVPTVANGAVPPGETPSPDLHGNGRLWTGLWPDGVIRANPRFVRPDGSVGMKFWWWADVPLDGRGLVIEGTRTDGTAPPLRVEGPSPGWPENDFRGTGFWASGLVFPTEGCWKVTATAGGATLTFVTRVEKVPG